MKIDTDQISLSRVPLVLDRVVRMRPAHAWMIVLLCTDLVALGDVISGPRLWFGPGYLFVICLATWALGWRAGQAMGIGCMALTFAVNGPSLYPYGGAALAGNLAMRFVAVSAIVAVIAGARRAYVREWWLARTDILTGALNRQAFFELGHALAGSCCWRLLIYADLDGLKAINDGEGHGAGDLCLQVYAATVRRIIRRTDMFARVGGDEFLVFMSVTNESAARAVAARLHAAMNDIAADTSERLRCSVGALVVAPGRLSIDELVRRADDLMYQAKLRGAGLEIAVASDVEVPARTSRARALPRAPAAAVPERHTLAERRSATL